ncbi:MAG: molecular chaperone GrpE [Patescibacteria group bacterium]|nr:molecular chaperone GrpE [Patescibacteria group bacterium]
MKEKEQNIKKEVTTETTDTTTHESQPEPHDDIVFEEVNEDVSHKASAQWEDETDALVSIKKLKETIKKLEQEKADYMNAWTRAQADYLNFKKETESKRKNDIAFASKKIIGDILPALDSFTLAKQNKEAWEKVDSNWRVGIEYIFGQLESALQKEGLESFGEVGDRFDPSLHESVEMVPVETERESDTLVAILQKGYKLHDEVIREAKVKTGHYEAK